MLVSYLERNKIWGLNGTLFISIKIKILASKIFEPLKRTQRKPMFVLELAGELFRFSVKTPALEVLFQLPPRLKALLILSLLYLK